MIHNEFDGQCSGKLIKLREERFSIEYLCEECKGHININKERVKEE